MNNKQIAKQIKQDYFDGRFAYIDGDRVEFNPTGAFTVRCRHSIEAVHNLCKRFEKGLPYNGLTQSAAEANRAFGRGKSTRGVCSITTFLSFWEDGELENAKNYLDLFPQEKWPEGVKKILGQEAA